VARGSELLDEAGAHVASADDENLHVISFEVVG
jgi:hypothetical protein